MLTGVYGDYLLSLFAQASYIRSPSRILGLAQPILLAGFRFGKKTFSEPYPRPS